MLKIVDFEKDKPKINQEFRELEDYKRRLRELEKQVRRLTKKDF